MKASNILIAMLIATIVAGLCLEGIHSITMRSTLESRLQNIEEKQNYLFELIIATPDSVIPAIGASAIRIERTSRTVAYEELDLFCLAKNIFHEAGVEDELGMFAVAQVTINRVRNARYPNSICDVVMQSAQFSWTNDRSRRWTHPSGPKWELSKQIAKKVIKDGYRVPALQAAMFYHADYVSPNWRDPNAVVAQIGTHIFYTTAR
jgi:N-acetylmuramoyl-L-alanine amidase